MNRRTPLLAALSALALAGTAAPTWAQTAPKGSGLACSGERRDPLPEASTTRSNGPYWP